MQRYRLIFTLFLLTLASASQAKDLIVLYNYSSPLPVLNLMSMVPADHQQMHPSPRSVEFSFSQSIMPERSTVKIYDPYNNQLNSMVTAKDTFMSATLPPNLLAGTYRVEWNATCVCQGNPGSSGTSHFNVY